MKFTEKKERNQYGMKMDVSELLLEHQQNHAQLTLVKGQVATSPQSVATFVYTWGGRKEFQVRKDQEFPLATAEGNRTYKLIDVHPDKAVIVNTQEPGAPIEIGFASPLNLTQRSRRDTEEEFFDPQISQTPNLEFWAGESWPSLPQIAAAPSPKRTTGTAGSAKQSRVLRTIGGQALCPRFREIPMFILVETRSL